MQLSIFNLGCEKPYKIKKPIRLIELFGGIGSQAKALENLKANFTHYRLCEFDKYAVTSYNAVHGTNFATSDITKITADDLGIVDTDKYEYIMTYSFPCQDLSIAGKQAGMEKGSGTRSGLLWEVERLLEECEELPQVLLMENVPQVLNCDFGGWLEFLESKGYHNYYKCLNAKNYGIPQNRNRCFMVSVLGNYYYDFPKEIPLKLRLKDMLEDEVDEKYYLSDSFIKKITINKNTENYIEWERINGELEHLCRAYKEDKNICTLHTKSNEIKVLEATKKGYAIAKYGDGVYINRPHQKRGVVQKDKIQTLKTSCDDVGVVVNSNIKNIMTKIASTLGTNCGSSTSAGGGVVIEPKTNERFFRQAIEVVGNYSPSGHEASRIVHPEGVSPTIKENHGTVTATVEPNLRIRKLTPKECWRLMGFTDSDFDKAKASGVSNSQLYKQAGNSIVVNVLEEIFKKLF